MKNIDAIYVWQYCLQVVSKEKIWFIGIQIAHSLYPHFSILPLSELVVLAWVLPKLTIIPRENKQGTEIRVWFNL